MVIYGLLMVPSLTATVGQKSTDLNAHNTQTSHQVGYTYSTMCIYIYITLNKYIIIHLMNVPMFRHNKSATFSFATSSANCKICRCIVGTSKPRAQDQIPPIGPGWWGMLPTCRQLCALKYSPRDLLYGNGLKCSPLPYFIYHGSMEWFEMILMLLGNSPSTIGR